MEEWLGGAKFSDLKIPFRAVATDLMAGTSVVFRSGKLAPALRATSAIPGAFAPVTYQKRTFMDGGVSNPVPDDIVRAMGADIVLAVDLNGVPWGKGIKKVPPRAIGDILEMAVNILSHHLAVATTKDADIVLRPYLEK